MSIESTLARFITLRKDKSDTAVMAREIQDEINDIEPVLLAHFEKTGTQKITQNGLTVYLKRDLYAGLCEDGSGSKISEEVAKQALKDAGLSDFCLEKINTTGLSAFFRELDEAGQELPEQLVGKFKANEVFKISSRKA